MNSTTSCAMLSCPTWTCLPLTLQRNLTALFGCQRNKFYQLNLCLVFLKKAEGAFIAAPILTDHFSQIGKHQANITYKLMLYDLHRSSTLSIRFQQDLGEMAFDLGMKEDASAQEVHDRLRERAHELTHAQEAGNVGIHDTNH